MILSDKSKTDRLLQYAYCSGKDILDVTDVICQLANKDNVEGDFAEAGVAMGVHPVIMSQYGRRVHLFDSFEGICTHGDKDIEFTQAYGKGEDDGRKSSGITSCSLDEVKKVLNEFAPNGLFEYYKGWYEDTLPTLPDDLKFSVLRLDCDLYSSYKLCFEYLYPKLSKGGYLIIDDWTLSGCQEAVKEYFTPEQIKKFNQHKEIAWMQKN